MTTDHHDHTDPNPVRPSQAEGDAEDIDEPSADPAEDASPAPRSGGDHADPNPLRPSQAEGE